MAKKRRKRSPLRILMDPKRIILAIVIGLGVSTALIIRDFDAKTFSMIDWTTQMIFWVILGFGCIAVRDLCYMYRLRVLTHGQLSWRKTFDVIFLWEFASSVTPSVIGGTPVAIFLLNKEGLSVGKSTTIVLLTAMFDELFFIIMVPVLYFSLIHLDFFPEADRTLLGIPMGTQIIFGVSYAIICFYTLFISYGIFINPHGLKRLIVWIFKLPLLNRWKKGAIKTGDEIITASKEVKKNKPMVWVKAFLATYFSWTARYWVVNCLILAFVAVDNHFHIYARQLVMWVIMLISPTPGAGGVAEASFERYLGEYLPDGVSVFIGLLWRLVSYYPYLLIGVIILPRWLRRVYIKRKLIKFKSPEAKKMQASKSN